MAHSGPAFYSSRIIFFKIVLLDDVISDRKVPLDHATGSLEIRRHKVHGHTWLSHDLQKRLFHTSAPFFDETESIHALVIYINLS
jgi:hypothetical protein